MKTCILHDIFLYKWGAERLALMMTRALGADLAAGFFDSASFDPKKEGIEGKIIPLLAHRWGKWIRHVRLAWAFAKRTKFLRSYDCVVLSGDCLSAVRYISPHAKTLYYCHTPPRYLFDQKEAYLRKVPWFLRPIYLLMTIFFRWRYFHDLEKIDVVFSNSENTRQRLLRFTGRDSIILHPAVDCSRFVPSAQRKEYYFSFARFASIKRVDLVVRAFQTMPEKKIILAYGPNDPQKEEILRMIQGFSNIETRLLPSDEKLRKLIAESIATIYIPRDEDFGMSPIESMACGVPVIGVDEWWLRETIIHDTTGILVNAKITPELICKAVKTLDLSRSLSMQKDCTARAREFSVEVFGEKLRKSVESRK